MTIDLSKLGEVPRELKDEYVALCLKTSLAEGELVRMGELEADIRAALQPKLRTERERDRDIAAVVLASWRRPEDDSQHLELSTDAYMRLESLDQSPETTFWRCSGDDGCGFEWPQSDDWKHFRLVMSRAFTSREDYERAERETA